MHPGIRSTLSTNQHITLFKLDALHDSVNPLQGSRGAGGISRPQLEPRENNASTRGRARHGQPAPVFATRRRPLREPRPRTSTPSPRTSRSSSTDVLSGDASHPGTRNQLADGLSSQPSLNFSLAPADLMSTFEGALAGSVLDPQHILQRRCGSWIRSSTSSRPGRRLTKMCFSSYGSSQRAWT